MVFQLATCGGLEDFEGVKQWAGPLMASRALDKVGMLSGKISVVMWGAAPFVEIALCVAGAWGLGMVLVNLSDTMFTCLGTAGGCAL